MTSIEFTYSLEIGHRALHVVVNANASFYTENYGEDADGNRGEMRTYADDMEVEVFDLSGKNISEKLLKKYPHAWSTLDELAYEKLSEAYEER